MIGSRPTSTTAIRVTCLSKDGSRAGEKMEAVGAQDDIGEAPADIGRGSSKSILIGSGLVPDRVAEMASAS